jgi:glycine dehydrogenase subunit 1
VSYVGRSEAERRQMLDVLGVERFESLLREIPPAARLSRPLALGEPRSEVEQRRELKALASANAAAAGLPSFLGGGMYDHYIPASVFRLITRSEFLTAYTPYQPEVAQGTLTAIFEFQSMIAELFALDVANASLYDGASALAEACLVARAHTGRTGIVVAGALHPHAARVLTTVLGPQAVRALPLAGGVAREVPKRFEEDVAAVVVPYPNFFGLVDEAVPALAAAAHAGGALVVASVDPIAMARLTPPGEWGADLCVAEGQPLGVPASFGGPALGLFAARRSLLRRLPGRLVGETVDGAGRRGFVLTLQTREQHIRREKATSNICTNQGLMALAATIHLALLGKQGLTEVADLCFHNTHYAARLAAERAGLGPAYAAPFFREFVLELPLPARRACRAGLERGLLVGVDLGRLDAAWERHLLVAVTEKRTRPEIEAWADVLARLVREPRPEPAVTR